MPSSTVTVQTISDAYEGGTDGVFRFTRTGDLSDGIEVELQVTGTATQDDDYTFTGSSIFFAANESSVDLDIEAIADHIIDPDETVTVTIEPGMVDYDIGSPASATLTIHEPPVVMIEAANDSAEGGTDGTFVISRTGNTSQALTVGYSVGGTATNSVDFPLLSGSVTIPANASAINVSIDGYHDGQIEGDETVTLTVSAGSGYTVDSQNNSATLTVIDTDLDPVAFDWWFSSSIDLPIAIAALDYATDLNGDTLSLTTVTQGENGTVSIGQGGSVTYTPDTGYVGDDAFTYTVEDQFGNDATGSITVTVDGLQALPTSVWIAQNTAITIDVPDITSDPDGQTLSTSAVTQGAHGSVVINGDGTVTYTPNTSFTGDDHFDYTVEDPDGHTATQTITMTVGVVGPVAIDNDATTAMNTAVTVTVANGAFDPAGGSVTVTAVTQGAHGSVVLNQDGTVTYTPANGYQGSDSFTYTVTDGVSNTATGMVTVTVGAPSSQLGAIMDDLTDIEDEIDNYNEGTPEAIEAALPNIAQAISGYTDVVNTSLDGVLSSHLFQAFPPFDFLVVGAYKTLYDEWFHLHSLEDRLARLVIVHARLVESLAWQILAESNAPAPNKNLLNGLKVAAQMETANHLGLFDLWLSTRQTLWKSFARTSIWWTKVINSGNFPGLAQYFDLVQPDPYPQITNSALYVPKLP